MTKATFDANLTTKEPRNIPHNGKPKARPSRAHRQVLTRCRTLHKALKDAFMLGLSNAATRIAHTKANDHAIADGALRCAGPVWALLRISS